MSGGKGGSNQTVAYYYAPVAFAICEGPIVGIKQIWAGGNLIFSDSQPVAVNTYQGGGKKSGPTVSTSYQQFSSITQNDTQTGGSALGPWTCYLGTETQPTDPTIGEGVAYRGVAYIVFNPLNLGPGATIPPLTFEVVTVGTYTPPEIEWEFTNPTDSIYGNWSNGLAFDSNGNPVFVSFGNKTVWTKLSAANGQIMQYGLDGIATAGYSLGYYNGKYYGCFYLPNGQTTYSSGSQGVGTTLFPSQDAVCEFDPDSGTINALYGVPNAVWLPPVGQADTFCYVVKQNASYAAFPKLGVTVPVPGNGGAYIYGCTVNGVFYMTGNGASSLFIFNTETLQEVNLTNATYYSVATDGLGNVFCCYTDSSGDSWIAQVNQTGGVIEKFQVAVAGPICYAQGNWWLGNARGTTQLLYQYTSSGVLLFTMSGFIEPTIIEYIGGSLWVGTGSILFKVNLSIAIILGTMTLPAAVTILCERAGIAQFDVSQLPAVPVNFVRGDTVTARSMLTRLSQAYFFSMVDSGGVLRFVPQGQPSQAVIPLEDLGFDKVSANAQTPYTASRISGVDLPRSVKIRYISPALNWEKYEQVFALESYESGKEITLDLPLILDDQTAYNIAALACTLPHAERMQYSFTTSYKWLALEPGDVVTLPFGTCRILTVKMGQKNGIPVLDFTACIDGINALAGAGYATPALPNYQPNTGGITALLAAPANLATTQTPGSPTPHPIATAPQMVQTVPNAGVPKMVLVEPPPLSSTDTGMRFMAGAYSTGNAFPGAAIFQSSDGGNTYTQLTTEISATLAGYANTVLPAPSGPYNNNNSYTWDNFSTVDVYLLGNGGDLTPAPDLNVMNGANGAMLGSELIQYANATLMTDSLGNPFYRLSRLLRGRKGTEWAMGTHQVGEPFFAIPSALSKEPYTPPMLNNAYLYKVVMMGGDLGNAPAKSYEPSGASMMQWAPCEVLTSLDGSGDWTVSWVPRARYNGDWASGFISYLDPDTTGWSIDIMSGTTVKRTIQVPLTTTGPWNTIYTAAMQSADGFSAGQTGIAYNLYQLSQSVGRGYVTSGTTGAAPAEI